MPSITANPINTTTGGATKTSIAQAKEFLGKFASPAAVVKTDSIVACNRALRELLEVSSTEAVRETLQVRVFSPVDKPGTDRLFRHPRLNKWLSVSRTGFRIDDGLELWLFHDWTEIQEASQAMQDADEALLRGSRFLSVGEMTTTLAHEINQPLAAIVNYLNVAKRMLRPGAAGDVMAPIVEASDQADRASAIVKRLREFVQSREPKSELIAVPNLIESSIRAIQLLADQCQAQLSCELDDPLPFVAGDRVLLEQVLVNFVKNALEAASGANEVPIVVIRAQLNLEQQIEILVSDNGPGLAPSIEGRLFEPFATSKATGMGVGLSISRSIVEYHHGRIFHRPNPEGGCTFGLSLPVKARA